MHLSIIMLNFVKKISWQNALYWFNNKGSLQNACVICLYFTIYIICFSDISSLHLVTFSNFFYTNHLIVWNHVHPSIWLSSHSFNTLRLRQNGCHFHGWPSTQSGTCTQPCPIVHTAVPPLFTQPCSGRTMSTAVCIYVAGLCASCPAV